MHAHSHTHTLTHKEKKLYIQPRRAVMLNVKSTREKRNVCGISLKGADAGSILLDLMI